MPLLPGVGHFHHGVGQTPIGQQFHQPVELRDLRCLLLAGELHEKDGVRLTEEVLLHHGPELIVATREPDHRAVDELHRLRIELHDLLRDRHRIVERREMRDAQHLVRGQGLQRELEASEPRERALRAHQQVREVVRRQRLHHVEVVALDAPQHLRPSRFDLVPLARRDGVDASHQCAIPRRTGCDLGRRAERAALAVREPRLDREDVVHHVAVADRTGAARVVAGHAAQRRLRTGGDIHRVPESRRPQMCIQVIEHDAGLHPCGARLGVDLDDAIQMARRVDDECGTDRLTALRRAATARQHRHPGFGGNGDGRRDVVLGLGHHDAERQDLVDRSVRRVAPAARGVEEHIAPDLAGKATGDGIGNGGGGHGR